MTDTTTSQHERLLAALTAAGWSTAATSRRYRRLAYPRFVKTTTIYVPTDTDYAPDDYREMLTDALAELGELAALGQAAQKAIDGIDWPDGLTVEAQCGRCDQMFLPANPGDLIHIADMETGEPCGGVGQVTGSWRP